jgi:hypothetical protein
MQLSPMEHPVGIITQPLHDASGPSSRSAAILTIASQ